METSTTCWNGSFITVAVPLQREPCYFSVRIWLLLRNMLWFPLLKHSTPPSFPCILWNDFPFMKWQMKTYTLIDSFLFLAHSVWERAVCICFPNPGGHERSRWWDSDWSSGTPANWVLFSCEELVQSTAVFSTLFFREECRKLLAEKDLALDSCFSPFKSMFCHFAVA